MSVHGTGLRMVALAIALGWVSAALSAPHSRAARRIQDSRRAVPISTDLMQVHLPAPEGMVWIPSGTFTMGTPLSELGRYASESEHTVTISQSFLMATTPVTQAEWFAVMGTNPSFFGGCDDCPVEKVSWYDAVDYCNAASLLDGLAPAYDIDTTGVTWLSDTNGYRLPTESEWEYACRAGTSTAFYNGDITDTACNDPNLSLIGWYCGNNTPNGTKEVAQKTPNAWGLYDNSGNAQEWCWDWLGDYPPGPVIDPLGPPAGPAKVIRGGSFATIARNCRSGNRFISSPDSTESYLGFRVVRSDL